MKTFRQAKVGDTLMVGTHNAIINKIDIVRRKGGWYQFFISYWFKCGFGSSLILYEGQLDQTSIKDFEAIYYEGECKFELL